MDRGCWGGLVQILGETRDEALLLLEPRHYLQGAGTLQQGPSQMGGMAICATGRAPTLDCGCSLQIGFHYGHRATRQAWSRVLTRPSDGRPFPHHTTRPEHAEFTGVSVNPAINHLVNFTIILHCIFIGGGGVKCICLLKVNTYNGPLFWVELQKLKVAQTDHDFQEDPPSRGESLRTLCSQLSPLT